MNLFLIETEQNPAQSFSTSHSGLEDEDHPMTSAPTSSSKDYKTQLVLALAINKKSNILRVFCGVFGEGASIAFSFLLLL